MPPPERWSEIRAWLLSLTAVERRYLRAWMARWMRPDGKIPHHRNFVGHVFPPNGLDEILDEPDPPLGSWAIRFRGPDERR